MPTPERPTARRSTLRTGVVLFLVTAAVYLATAGYQRIHIDVLSADIGAWRIASTGEPWIEGLDLDQLNHSRADVFTTTNGEHVVIGRSPGVVAASVPAYALRQLLTGAGTTTDDFTDVPGALTAASLTAVTVLLMWGALLRLVPRRAATVAALAFGFTTPVWSVAADGMWTHTLTLLGISGIAWAAARERWLLLGVFGGIALWGRPHTAVAAAAVALTCAWVQRRPRVAVRAAAGGAVLTAGASLWTHWLYDQWIPSGGYSASRYLGTGVESQYQFNHTVGGLLRNEAAMWVAPDRGVLVWTPAILVLLPLLVRTWRSQPAWTRALLLAGVFYTLFQGAVAPFHGGDGIYGYRHGLELLACTTPALAVAAVRAGPRTRTLLTGVLGLQLAAFTLGGVLNRPTLTFDLHWRSNAFAWALWKAPALWLVLACFVAGAFLIRRMFLDPSSPLPTAAGDADAVDLPDRVGGSG